MPLQATSGAASYDGFGGGVAVVPAYIEDVMSTYVYTGTGATQTITNGIDTTTYGGLVWTKARYLGISHRLVDTARGATYEMSSDTTDASSVNSTGLTSFGTTGYTIGSAGGYNNSGGTYTSWSLRKQPKFFDVVTYTGNGAAARAISHNLGSTPGCMIVKRTDAAGDWRVYHRGCSTDNGLVLNDTAAQTTSAIYWFGNEVNVIPPTSTQFTVNAGFTNTNGGTYVAYLFAHDAGGFGLTGTDNVISCGSYTTDGSGNATINLGYEPQWLLVKNTSAPASWIVVDNMRGFGSATDSTNRLNPNTSGAEITGSTPYYVTSTGFTAESGPSVNFIYIAIRRGPMKVPTLGTSVFQPIARAGTGVTTIVTGVGFPSDLIIARQYTTDNVAGFFNRLIGPSKYLATPGDVTLRTGTNSLLSFDMDGMTVGSDVGAPDYIINRGEGSYINYFLRRCPGVFDTVCDTGTGSVHTISHNLNVVPELILRKETSPDNTTFIVYAGVATSFLLLGTAQASQTNSGYWNNTSPTSSVFTVGTNPSTNQSGDTFVSNLFATCPGVSKVGSYTGTGTTKQVDCGFTGGARFVLIKRTDSTGDWYVWDSARGISSGDDPYFLLNSTAREVTTTDYVDTYSAGFEISSTAPAAINASGGTFIFLAIA